MDHPKCAAVLLVITVNSLAPSFHAVPQTEVTCAGVFEIILILCPLGKALYVSVSLEDALNHLWHQHSTETNTENFKQPCGNAFNQCDEHLNGAVSLRSYIAHTPAWDIQVCVTRESTLRKSLLHLLRQCIAQCITKFARGFRFQCCKVHNTCQSAHVYVQHRVHLPMQFRAMAVGVKHSFHRMASCSA